MPNDYSALIDALAIEAGKRAANILLGEVGYHAYWSGGSKMNKFAQWFDDMYRQGQHFYGGYVNGWDWCVIAFDWAICKTFGIANGKAITYQSGGPSAGCPTRIGYYKSNGAFISRGTGMPRPGDQIFYDWQRNMNDGDHTGMVYKVDGSNVYTVEGNNGNSPGHVSTSCHSLYDPCIIGYGRPNYKAVINQVIGSLDGVSYDEEGQIQINPTLSAEVLSAKEKGVDDLINKLTTYIEGYNSGKYSLKQLTSVKEQFAKRLESFKEYVAQQKERNITNYEDLETIYKKLVEHEFPQIDELARVEALGSNEWFSIFNQSYDQLIKDFYSQLVSIIKGVETEVLKNVENMKDMEELEIEDFMDKCVKQLLKEDYKKGNKIIFNPTVTHPEDSNAPDGVRYMWRKMFADVSTIKIKSDFDTYKNDDKFKVDGQINYDLLCYESLKTLLIYYNEQITTYSAKLDQAIQEKDFEATVQQQLNILQAQIFKLYASTFGNIGREEESVTEEKESGDEDKTEKSVVYKYIKKGPCYNFGGKNEKYKNFCEKAKDTIFKDKLYLKNIDLTEILNNIVLIITEKKKQYNSEKTIKQNNSYLEANYKIELRELRSSLMNNSEVQVHVDWRELIYQMAKDYYNYAHNPLTQGKYQEFLLTKNSNIMGLPESELNLQGNEFRNTTGYEVFYTDILGFWRQLYFNPILEDFNYEIGNNVIGYSQIDYNNETGWYNMVSIDPSKLNFWFDLTEGSGELSNYSILEVGDRLKATKDSNVKSLYYKDVPNIILYEQDDIATLHKVENDGYASYSYFQIGGPLLDAYSISSQGRSALDLLQELLYKFAYCVENVTITTLPVYTLRPNYRILVQSHISGLSGEYIVNKYSIPLVYNGTMSITATKAVPYIGINK